MVYWPVDTGYVNVPVTMRYILKNRNLLLLFIASGLFFFNEMLLMPTLPLYLSDLGYSHLALGSVLGSFALGVLVMRPVAGLVTDRKSRKISLIIASVVVIAWVDSLSMLISAALLYGIGSTICMPALTALIADTSDAQTRGRVYSFFYGAFDLGVISAGVSLWFLAVLLGLRGMFMVAAGMGFAAALFFMLTIQPQVSCSVRWTLFGK